MHGSSEKKNVLFTTSNFPLCKWAEIGKGGYSWQTWVFLDRKGEGRTKKHVLFWPLQRLATSTFPITSRSLNKGAKESQFVSAHWHLTSCWQSSKLLRQLSPALLTWATINCFPSVKKISPCLANCRCYVITLRVHHKVLKNYSPSQRFWHVDSRAH